MTQQNPNRDLRPSCNVSDELDGDGFICLDRFAPALITWAAHRLAANNSLAYRSHFDITLMEWRVILHLAERPGSTAGMLAQTIGFDKATISRTVDSLHRRLLIDERLNPADARSTQLELAESGLELYRAIVPVALDQERQLLGDLSPSEAETLVSLLGRVVEALRRQPAARSRGAKPTAGTPRRLQRRLAARD